MKSIWNYLRINCKNYKFDSISEDNEKLIESFNLQDYQTLMEIIANYYADIALDIELVSLILSKMTDIIRYESLQNKTFVSLMKSLRVLKINN